MEVAVFLFCLYSSYKIEFFCDVNYINISPYKHYTGVTFTYKLLWSFDNWIHQSNRVFSCKL